MYLAEVQIEGYKIFKEKFVAKLNEGLTVIVGENGAGKSAIVDAIRVLLAEEEFLRAGITESDFHRELSKQAKERGVDKIAIKGVFEKLGAEEQVAYLPWLSYSDNSRAILNVAIENKEDSLGRFKWNRWGNETVSGVLEMELIDAIRCIYLPPLRNAPEKLQAYRGSRLVRLLKNLTRNEDPKHREELESQANKFNKTLLQDKHIKAIDKIIREKITDAVGSVFGQDSMVQFSEVSYNRIIERLRLLFYPTLLNATDPDSEKMYRELGENSLGYNNILYLATVLAELEGLESSDVFMKILLIEEPEAHLHPQLQSKLLQYLKEQSKKEDMQIIVTTHSPTIAASVGLENIKVVTIDSNLKQPEFCSLSQCGLKPKDKYFVERWLDITKSILLFARAVLFVEGIAEALIVPELAKSILAKYGSNFDSAKRPETLEDLGISVININGIYFDCFMQLFSGFVVKEDGKIDKSVEKINILCAGITDNDPENDGLPTSETPMIGKNKCLPLIKLLQDNSANCRLYPNLKTFEYDLALAGNNLKAMAGVLKEEFATEGPLKAKAIEYFDTNWNGKSESDKAIAAKWILDRLNNNYPIGKGEFSQLLSFKLYKKELVLTPPKYVEEAIEWLIPSLNPKTA